MDIKFTKNSRGEFIGSKSLKLNRISNLMPRLDKCISALGTILRSDVTSQRYELHLMMQCPLIYMSYSKKLTFSKACLQNKVENW